MMYVYRFMCVCPHLSNAVAKQIIFSRYIKALTLLFGKQISFVLSPLIL